ncbi:GNAT family N-acetyltransferase [Lactonifactor longoviformis]|uniref:GNAT family N-acetyltransferase n=1 Tax=Lactonifactor TaxID=420345 RepID=UPI0012AFE0E8|nr:MULTISPECIES: GNAT family N-acetyltransferase [Lactonifactor]MCB5713074.1 GNAT family N-acetyltransferase [Lactonifactor longoviformis]MCB5717290.1 GNAT family N-acetyltransferase [Lactonifactor longoviformis]MCQ4673417.1 GNAT family N-acetyltransferase [Lactonifactor longoviformis]
MKIQTYVEADREEVISLVLHCQNDGTRPFVSVDDQPELLHIKEKFLDNGGNFWVAKEQGKVVGSVGLMMCGSGLGVLKKFFVSEAYRGKPHHLGRKLYKTLLNFAKENGVKRIILDTPKNADRAHKFYEKAGFHKIEKEELPVAYDYPYKDSDFFSIWILTNSSKSAEAVHR